MIKTSILSFIHITTSSIHDVNIMDLIPYQKGCFYVADNAYTHFNRLPRIHTGDSFFVIGAKEDLYFHIIYARAVDKIKGVFMIWPAGCMGTNQRINTLRSSDE